MVSINEKEKIKRSGKYLNYSKDELFLIVQLKIFVQVGE